MRRRRAETRSQGWGVGADLPHTRSKDILRRSLVSEILEQTRPTHSTTHRGTEYQIVSKGPQDHEEDVLTLLLDRCPAYFTITQSKICSAAKRQDYGESIMKLLQNSDCSEKQFDNEAVSLLAKPFGPNIMQCIVTRLGSDFAITKSLIELVTHSKGSG